MDTDKPNLPEVIPTMQDRIDDLKLLTGITTNEDLFNNAISLLEWAAHERAAGREIGSFDDVTKKRKLVALAALSNIKQKH